MNEIISHFLNSHPSIHFISNKVWEDISRSIFVPGRNLSYNEICSAAAPLIGTNIASMLGRFVESWK